jgi:hypothetical protein
MPSWPLWRSISEWPRGIPWVAQDGAGAELPFGAASRSISASKDQETVNDPHGTGSGLARFFDYLGSER